MQTKTLSPFAFRQAELLGPGEGPAVMQGDAVPWGQPPPCPTVPAQGSTARINTQPWCVDFKHTELEPGSLRGPTGAEFSGPTTIQPSLQALAVLFPPGCSSSLLFFLQLLLLEWALESPDFAELLKVVTENPASNLFQYSFGNSSS